ncbi:MAG TPA: hypothetical protein VJR89_09215, partial [Polyangiales bacterium]|nr:hypothetical protein [Polyangiales bacterium]
MFRTRFDSQQPPACLFGRTPCRIGIVRSGLWQSPEQSLHGWFARALAEAPSALPARAVRFVVAPHDTPLLGVWIASRDATGSEFPLLYARRVLGALRALPWPLLLTAGSQLLAAAESCLLWARSGEIEPAWRLLAGLPPPGSADLADLYDEAELEWSREPGRAERRARLLAATSSRDLSQLHALELPAQADLDVCAWLGLLRELHPSAPRGLFWCPER